MSASTIARWNAIPLQRTEQPESLKRPRPDEEDDDDDVSIASRTPSPQPDGMDVDQDITMYDEHLRAPAREVITVETKIKPTNKGFAMLAKLGWSEGQPLGLSGDGRVDPIPFQMKSDATGIGKANQDVRMIESTVSQRRVLEVERQQRETDEQRQAREDAVARKSALATQISDTLKAFYCALCDKQFQNVAQYDEHTNSYAHHHKARFKDMQASMRLKPQEEVDKRKEKERKREEKELRKMAAASGIKMTKQVTPNPTLVSIPSSDSSSKSGSSGGGWATVSSSSSSSGSGGFKKSAWATVGSTPSSTTISASTSAPAPSEAPPPPPPSHSSPGTPHQPSFRTGGWTSLDTSPSGVTTSSTISVPHISDTAVPLPLSPPPQQRSSTYTPNNDIPKSPPVSMDPTSHPQAPPLDTGKPSRSQASRAGWQQFQKNNKRK